MLFRIFKNDIIKGKMNNIVMLLFVLISSLLACSSISLLYSSTHQISYFMNDMGNVADLNFTMMNIDEDDKHKINTFLSKEEIKDYELEEDITLSISNMKFIGHDDISSTGCYATTLPKRYNLIFDEDSNIPTIKEGEIGIPLSIKKQLNLSKGDRVEVTRGQQVFTYTISSFVRDSLYGSEMVGQKRFIFHETDYRKQYEATSQEEHSVVLSIKSSKHRENLEYAMQEANLPNYILVTKDTASLSFIGLQAGSSAIMLASSLILLCIGFLIIRFTIMYQIEESYIEIGIMKAIGLSHAHIKSLYIAKYMGLAICGAITGFVLSIPFTNVIEQMQGGVVPLIPTNMGTYISSVVMIIIVIMVYILTTRILHKIKKQSAMDAIRKGNNGETFQSHATLMLSKTKRLPITMYLTIADILAKKKQTLMMVGIYACSLLLILIPLLLKNTFTQGAFLDVINLSRGDLYTKQEVGSSMSGLEEKRKQVEKDLKKFDPNVQVTIESSSSAILSNQGVTTSAFLTIRASGNDTITYDKGKAPKLSNEIAMSSTLADKYDKTIGDTITISIENEKKEYFITGIYTSMMNLGNNILAGKELQYEYAYIGYLVINFSGSENARLELANKVMKEYERYEVINTDDMIVSFSGDMATQVGALSDVMSVIFLVIVFALSILFAKMQIIKSRKAIVILQSLGYPIGNIRSWQMCKRIFEVCIGVCVGILLHFMISARLLSAFFKSIGMGNIHLESDVVTTVLIYPMCFIIVTVLAQVMVNHTIFKWNVKELSEE